MRLKGCGWGLPHYEPKIDLQANYEVEKQSVVGCEYGLSYADPPLDIIFAYLKHPPVRVPSRG